MPGSVDRAFAIRMYKCMLRMRAMDHVFYNAQRQGRISFYMTSTGEEGSIIGSAAALQADDTVFAQYREVGILHWRGMSMQEIADQCFSNADGHGLGRQMPNHYGSAKLHFHTISSPLATQIPHATGAAYKLKRTGRVAACYFGDGAASEGDFHAALNMAATLDVPALFICRNNGYAISTPTVEQFRGDGIISRAAGYGMLGVRVDGNDTLAVYEATKEARRISAEQSRPVLLELMTYRVGHHSTSDDWSRYRSSQEVEEWKVKACPVARFRAFIEKQGWWDEEQEREASAIERTTVMEAIAAAETKPYPAVSSMFDDVYSDVPPHLEEQRKGMLEHIGRHPDHYSATGKH